MKISIVTISFNQARFLEQAICSVLDQDYPDVEYIVVDPGSTDGSRDIIERYRDRIDKIIFEPDAGPADGLNKGFSYATGDIFGFVNSDDFLLPGALGTVAASFVANPDKHILSGHSLVVDEKSDVINRLISRRFSLERYVYGASVLAQQSTFFRAAPFQQIGGFNIDNKIAWDGELWVEFGLAGFSFGRITENLSAFRIYGDSISGSGKFLSLYKRYTEQMFVKVIGRDRIWLDDFIQPFYKSLEYLIHPCIGLQRLKCGSVVKKL